MRHFKFTAIIIFLCFLLILPGMLLAQDKAPKHDGLTDSEKARANNPLANTKAFNIQHYYRPQLSEVEGGLANTTWIRAAVPWLNTLWRLSLPLETRHVNNQSVNYSKSGIGDIDFFAAYLAVSKPTFTFGLGPAASFNTASDSTLGTGKNTLGVAAVVFAAPHRQFQTGGLVIWRTSIGGDKSRPDVSVLAVQPFLIWQMGKGFYFRSVPIWVFDLENGYYHVPIGFGIGQIFKINNIVFNFFIEPQHSALTYGPGQPVFQIYSALNMQF